MKKMLLMCGLLIGISAASFAQGGGRMRMNPADQAKNLQTALKLTDDQTAKVQAIFQAQSAKMDSVRTAANGDRDAMRQAMTSMRSETNTKVNAVLTPDQQTAYKKYQDDMRAQMMQRMQQNGGGGAPPSQE